MKIDIVNVGPDEAKAYLGANTHNRNMNLKMVAAYARDMKSGAWKANGETVKICEDGRVLDGQHRFAAIVMAGITLELIVISDLPAESQETMDLGRKRTAADALVLRGETNTNVLASVARRVCMWESGNQRFTNNPQPTAAEIIDTLERFPSIRRSADVGTGTNHSYRAANATVTGTAHHILHHVDQDAAAEFFAMLRTGAKLDVDHPVLTLRNRLQRDRDISKSVPFYVNVAYYLRAWNAYRKGQTLTQIIQTADSLIPKPL